MASRGRRLLPLITLPALAVAQPIHGSRLDGVSRSPVASPPRLGTEGPARLQLTEGSFSSIVEAEGAVKEWVVFFCKDELPGCQVLRKTFRDFGDDIARKVNSQRHLAPAVAFAEVDCGEERLLCSKQGLDSYPSVAHYVRGARPRILSPTAKLTQGMAHKASQALSSWLRASVGVDRPVPVAAPESGPIRLACALGSWAAAALWAILNLWHFVAQKPSVVRRGAIAVAEITPRADSSALTRRLPEEWAAVRNPFEL
eukprot:TRINITY_DN39867_c0_g1_i1.p1 TRINITY_DN39867_c0_g1~~TRINITY_DN39867_c0_g1_i1.p1  ORF type:complete len:257 (+),score=42.85 TRINITY_DN39867_c0_g1_i1:153-923(+)